LTYIRRIVEPESIISPENAGSSGTNIIKKKSFPARCASLIFYLNAKPILFYTILVLWVSLLTHYVMKNWFSI